MGYPSVMTTCLDYGQYIKG